MLLRYLGHVRAGVYNTFFEIRLAFACVRQQGLNADEEPNGVWYPLSKCELDEDGRYNVKVLDTDAAIEVVD